MKKLFLILASCAILSAAANAQPKDESWKTRMQSEKIAQITAELNLTPEEAQAFWPVYNQQSQLRAEAMKAVRESHKELSEALKEADDSKKSEKSVGKAIDKYVEALEKNKGIESEAVKQYRKVLPEEKVAKLLISEENFRTAQIRRFHQGPVCHPQFNGARQGGCNHFNPDKDNRARGFFGGHKGEGHFGGHGFFGGHKPNGGCDRTPEEPAPAQEANE